MSECIPCQIEARIRVNLELERKIAAAKQYAKNKKITRIVVYKTKNGYGYCEWEGEWADRYSEHQVLYVDP